MNKKLFYTKILIVLVLGLVAVRILVPEIFLANTPRIKPNLDKYIAFRVNNLLERGNNFIARIFNRKSEPSQEQLVQTVQTAEDSLKNIPFKQMTKGVYAKSNNNISYTIVRDNEIDWVEYSFDIKGKQVKIKVPRGEQPPSQETLESLE